VPAGQVEIAALGRPVVAGNPARAPAEVVRGADVGEEVEALGVAEMEAGFDQA
jgi:hypothetical protein